LWNNVGPTDGICQSCTRRRCGQLLFTVLVLIFTTISTFTARDSNVHRELPGCFPYTSLGSSHIPTALWENSIAIMPNLWRIPGQNDHTFGRTDQIPANSHTGTSQTNMSKCGMHI
jgi:hypothetical protein